MKEFPEVMVTGMHQMGFSTTVLMLQDDYCSITLKFFNTIIYNLKRVTF